jgi:hypothetical protein
MYCCAIEASSATVEIELEPNRVPLSPHACRIGFRTHPGVQKLGCGGRAPFEAAKRLLGGLALGALRVEISPCGWFMALQRGFFMLG